MEYLNRIELIGRIGHIRTSEIASRTLITMSVYTQHVFKNADGSPEIHGQWHNVEYWLDDKPQAPSLSKGTAVHVTGRLEYQRYTNIQGQEMFHPVIRVSTIECLPE